eukprot:15434883-Alexandrium_andersonii.AAC.1
MGLSIQRLKPNVTGHPRKGELEDLVRPFCAWGASAPRPPQDAGLEETVVRNIPHRVTRVLPEKVS